MLILSNYKVKREKIEWGKMAKSIFIVVNENPKKNKEIKNFTNKNLQMNPIIKNYVLLDNFIILKN